MIKISKKKEGESKETCKLFLKNFLSRHSISLFFRTEAGKKKIYRVFCQTGGRCVIDVISPGQLGLDETEFSRTDYSISE